MARLLYWCETTAQQPFEIGIQRVTRRLADGMVRLGVELLPIGLDARRRLLRPLGTATVDVSGVDGSEVDASAAGSLLVPEIPMAPLGVGLDPVQLAGAYGLRVAAVVHDLIPIRLASLYGAAERALFGRYFRMFAGADLVFVTTELVAGHLRASLADADLRVPEIAVVPLPGQFAGLPRGTQPPPSVKATSRCACLPCRRGSRARTCRGCCARCGARASGPRSPSRSWDGGDRIRC